MKKAKIDWQFTKALEDLADQYQKMGGNVKDVVIEGVEETQEALFDDYVEGLKRHENTGAAVDSLEITPVKVDGNAIIGEVGSSTDKNKAGFFHAVYQEYGARTSKGVVTFVADPWKRPADTAIKRKFNKIVKEKLKRGLGT